MAALPFDDLDEEALQQIYTWIDEIPLSRPKRNITRDFSDGVLIAEIVKHFEPKFVDMHNYTAANSSTQKMDNWNQLSRKVFCKLGYKVDEDVVKGIVLCKPGVVEHLLGSLRNHIEAYIARKKAAALIENNQIHDGLTADGNANTAQPAENSNGLNSSFNGYNYPSYTDPYGQPLCQAPQYLYNDKPTNDVQKGNVVEPNNIPNVTDGNHDIKKDLKSNDNTVTESKQSPKCNAGQVKAKKTDETPPIAEMHSTQPRHQVSSPKAKNNSLARKPVTQASKIKTKPPPKSVIQRNELSSLRISVEEKEQALLASQETVQIMQAKIRRLEHLLHLKDLRIDELKGCQKQQTPPPPAPVNYTLPPNHYPPPMHPQPSGPFPTHTSILPQIANASKPYPQEILPQIANTSKPYPQEKRLPRYDHD